MDMHLYDVDVDDDEDSRTRQTTPRRGAGITNSYSEVDIENRLGRFGVAANGDVAGIEFDDSSLRRMRPDAVGAYLVTAYQAAIRQARQRRVDDHPTRRG